MVEPQPKLALGQREDFWLTHLDPAVSSTAGPQGGEDFAHLLAHCSFWLSPAPSLPSICQSLGMAMSSSSHFLMAARCSPAHLHGSANPEAMGVARAKSGVWVLMGSCSHLSHPWIANVHMMLRPGLCCTAPSGNIQWTVKSCMLCMGKEEPLGKIQESVPRSWAGCWLGGNNRCPSSKVFP